MFPFNPLATNQFTSNVFPSFQETLKLSYFFITLEYKQFKQS